MPQSSPTSRHPRLKQKSLRKPVKAPGTSRDKNDDTDSDVGGLLHVQKEQSIVRIGRETATKVQIWMWILVLEDLFEGLSNIERFPGKSILSLF
ncbi:MAG TPA: hypothetical protein DHW07_01225 [Gammaproteobacteria bacterium]|nr:hypothetical protein [Gammaproteobacteria bacterium]